MATYEPGTYFKYIPEVLNNYMYEIKKEEFDGGFKIDHTAKGINLIVRSENKDIRAIALIYKNDGHDEFIKYNYNSSKPPSYSKDESQRLKAKKIADAVRSLLKTKELEGDSELKKLKAQMETTYGHNR